MVVPHSFSCRYVLHPAVRWTHSDDMDRQSFLDLELCFPVDVEIRYFVCVLNVHGGGNIDPERIMSNAYVKPRIWAAPSNDPFELRDGGLNIGVI